MTEKTPIECMFKDLASDYTKEQLYVKTLKLEAQLKELECCGNCRFFRTDWVKKFNYCIDAQELDEGQFINGAGSCSNWKLLQTSCNQA